VLQHALDVRSAPVEMEDLIQRKFERAELIVVWQNQYLQVGRTIFNVDARRRVLNIAIRVWR
jgi:hypothetical protein